MHKNPVFFTSLAPAFKVSTGFPYLLTYSTICKMNIYSKMSAHVGIKLAATITSDFPFLTFLALHHVSTWLVNFPLKPIKTTPIYQIKRRVRQPEVFFSPHFRLPWISWRFPFIPTWVLPSWLNDPLVGNKWVGASSARAWNHCVECIRVILM